MTNHLKKNFQWLHNILIVTGIVLLIMVILFKNPNIKLGEGAITLTRKEILMFIAIVGAFIAVMGGLAFPSADTHRKRSIALGIVIIGSAIVITSIIFLN